ncbi:centrosomal protein of 44 kDa isoform X4 [Fukomys damarensis]|uniref:centrosomal protein of 44 kDa isoform X4 n=1 Tax=Fukomys damarensis TaxID=885580 RepID=UPI0008FEC2E7|nr:centrosomal protein of 44 kDa isoform X4 [Fukomys damarensis]
MATGDLKRSLRKLEQVLRLLNYPREVDYVGLIKGDTAATLPIISYSLTSYSPFVTEHLMECNVELLAKNDLRFTDTVYKLLRDQFDYKPILTKAQFMQHGFAEWKIQIICDILNCVMKKHKELTGVNKTPSQPRKKIISAHSEPSSSNEKTPAEPVGFDVTGRFMTSGKDIKSNPELTALQTMLAECQEKLNKLTWIEKRLDSLEETMKGKVIVDEKTWTNLLSRITLLETEMLLSKKNEYVEFNAMSDDYTSKNDINLVTPDGTIKMERPASIPLSSGYNTESTDSTPRASTINYCGLKDMSEVRNTDNCLDDFFQRSRKQPLIFSHILLARKMAKL